MQPHGVMLATLVGEPFDDPEWIFETKWDGVRALCHIDARGGMTLRSRTGGDLKPAFPELAPLRRAFSGLPLTVDGEIVALDEHGRSSFQRLQARINRARPDAAEVAAVPVHFVVFDLLEHAGRDVTALPLERRRQLLQAAIVARDGVLAFSRDVRGTGKAAFAAAERAGLEGIVAKHLGSHYVGKRSRQWLKIKVQLRQEFVIGGWTQPRGSREHFGALLLGTYDGAGLRYAGSVGTGFAARDLHEVMLRLAPLKQQRSPFIASSATPANAHFVKPTLVAEVKFAEWTRDGSIRQPVFIGLRADKRARDVVRERPQDGSSESAPSSRRAPRAGR
ncbi:hypothetical protein EPN52_12555 [bacterium]|nr:MAG: hypothetical protein EPN52_12555 [bacterium]